MEWVTELEPALEQGRATGRPVFALVSVTWCPWCVRLDEETLSHPDVQAALAGLVCARLDGDQNERLPYDYDFDLYPTALLFGSDRAFLGLLEGFHEPGEFLDLLAELLED